MYFIVIAICLNVCVQILNAQVTDTGRYVCVAQNLAGTAEKYFNLHVHGKFILKHVYSCIQVRKTFSMAYLIIIKGCVSLCLHLHLHLVETLIQSGFQYIYGIHLCVCFQGLNFFYAHV